MRRRRIWYDIAKTTPYVLISITLLRYFCFPTWNFRKKGDAPLITLVSPVALLFVRREKQLSIDIIFEVVVNGNSDDLCALAVAHALS